MEEEKFICPECKTMITQAEITAEVENGGMGMCMCKYCITDKTTGDVNYLREYVEYVSYLPYRKNELYQKAKALYFEKVFSKKGWKQMIKLLSKKEQEELKFIEKSGKE